MPFLAFFATALGRQVLTWGIVALVGGGLLIGIRQSGYNAAMRKCQERALQLKLEAQNLDLKAAQEAAANSDRELSDSNTRLADRENKVAAYERTLKGNPGCILTDDDVSRDGVRKPGDSKRSR